MNKLIYRAFVLFFALGAIECWAYSLKHLTLEQISAKSDSVFIGRVVGLEMDGDRRIAIFDVIHMLKGVVDKERFIYEGSGVSEDDATMCCETNGVYLVFGVKGSDGYLYGANGPYSTYRAE
ncbi:hypothetical protein JVX91_04035 [Pseudomonas sp. PDNC002]|uniref:hypothetical protein n=1 Tax=Pseudomonas sp. PDNC002 TaxID=2811422 RepID=UPI00196511FC|nr:hypothetical protein [Pseudomonas sp. PDNC002]QRY80303.1 hypothetical protein JVX91_04035 [Pseudomonas sp. PDNC002]